MGGIVSRSGAQSAFNVYLEDRSQRARAAHETAMTMRQQTLENIIQKEANKMPLTFRELTIRAVERHERALINRFLYKGASRFDKEYFDPWQDSPARTQLYWLYQKGMIDVVRETQIQGVDLDWKNAWAAGRYLHKHPEVSLETMVKKMVVNHGSAWEALNQIQNEARNKTQSCKP